MECNNPSSSTSNRVDRRTIEKNRRIQMKGLYSKLHSLIPHDSSREMVSLPDQLHEAASYIKKLQIKLEKMNEEKNQLMGIKGPEIINHAHDDKKINNYNVLVGQQRTPQIDVRETGSYLEAILITGVDFQFLFSATIRVIHEEGFDVVNAGYSILNDTVFHTIHAQFLFSATIRVIHEEGFDVVNAGYSILNDTVFHTIHAQIREGYAQENGVSRIMERLQNIVNNGI